MVLQLNSHQICGKHAPGILRRSIDIHIGRIYPEVYPDLEDPGKEGIRPKFDLSAAPEYFPPLKEDTHKGILLPYKR